MVTVKKYTPSREWNPGPYNQLTLPLPGKGIPLWMSHNSRIDEHTLSPCVKVGTVCGNKIAPPLE